MRYAKYLVYELACHQFEWFRHEDTLSRFVVAEMQSVNLEPSSRGYQMRKIKIHRRISQSASDIFSFLAFHGTEINELGQIIDDLAFSAIGQYLFVNNEFLIRQTIQEILETSQTLNLNRLVICGYSLGGAIAQHVACVYPELVERVITFQAPGTSNYYLGLLRRSRNSLLSRGNIHFRVNGDILHYAGDDLLPGRIIYFRHPNSISEIIGQGLISPILPLSDAHLSLPLTTAYAPSRPGVPPNLGDSAISPDQSEMPVLRPIIEFGRTYMGARIRDAGSETSNEKTYIDLWEEMRHQIRLSPDGFTSEARSAIKRRIGNLLVDSPLLSERMLEQLTLLYPIHFPLDRSQSCHNISRDSRGSYPLGSWRNEARTLLRRRRYNIPTGTSVETAIHITFFQRPNLLNLAVTSPIEGTASVLIEGTESTRNKGGIVWQLEDCRDEVRIYTWNTSLIDRTDNRGHAEERFLSWINDNTQIYPYIKRITIRNLKNQRGFSPCSSCSQDLSKLLRDIKESPSPARQKPIEADIFWMSHYSSSTLPTSWQSIKELSDAGWNLHAPRVGFPDNEEWLSRRLTPEDQYIGSIDNPHIFPRHVESRSANERTEPTRNERTLPLWVEGYLRGIE